MLRRRIPDKTDVHGENLNRDLNSILNSFLDLVGCDGGSIFTLKTNENGNQVLVFQAMITRSVGIKEVPDTLRHVEFTLDETTLVGKTGFYRKFYREVSDANESELKTPTATDSLINYETRNVLSGPLLTPRGDLVGVVQLVNKNPDENAKPRNFSEQDLNLCAIVSGQAALAIENSMLLHEQEKILDGFVNACVTAIEARDPVTSGHSQRVCDLTLGLAEAVNHTRTGSMAFIKFSPTQMREMRYAAMLHDIGKISVKEDILNKEKKLYAWELTEIRDRFKLMRTALRYQYGAPKDELELKRKLKELDQAWNMIVAANEPSVMPKEVSESILDLTKLEVHIHDAEGSCCALSNGESERLRIPRGTLTKEERLEIERHVTFTHEILKMVPWSRGLERVPEIAHRHHEFLDGSGYPQKKKAREIPLQSRMLTICDIYDALTAKDRPYKAAVPIDKALAILNEEVQKGKLDAVLYQIFVDAKVYQIPTEKEDAEKLA